MLDELEDEVAGSSEQTLVDHRAARLRDPLGKRARRHFVAALRLRVGLAPAGLAQADVVCNETTASRVASVNGFNRMCRIVRGLTEVLSIHLEGILAVAAVGRHLHDVVDVHQRLRERASILLYFISSVILSTRHSPRLCSSWPSRRFRT